MHYAPRTPVVPAHGRVGWTALALIVAGTGCGVPAGTPADQTVAAVPSDQGALCRRIDVALTHARDARLLDAGVQGAWQVVHGILAFGPEFPLATRAATAPALSYLLDGGALVGWKLRPGNPGVIAIVEEGSTMGQGHPDQWLGYLSQCGVAESGDRLVEGIPLDTPLSVGGRRFTIADLLAQAQHDIRPGQEATWTLMALSAWLPHDAAWTSGDGERWTTERVVGMEAEADIASAACGGAHRLYGLAAAIDAHRRATGGPPTGAWAEAAAVRRTVRHLPSISALGAPVRPSSSR